MKIAIFLLSSVTSSQIWLSPLVDDYQTTYVTKLMKKRKEKKRKNPRNSYKHPVEIRVRVRSSVSLQTLKSYEPKTLGEGLSVGAVSLPTGTVLKL